MDALKSVQRSGLNKGKERKEKKGHTFEIEMGRPVPLHMGDHPNPAVMQAGIVAGTETSARGIQIVKGSR